MPEFHRLNKSKTTEMSREELNAKLREEAGRERPKPKESKTESRKQQKISEKTKKQMPPTSPARKKKDEERAAAEKAQLKQKKKEQKKRRRKKNYSAYYIMMLTVTALVFALLSVTVLFNAEQIVIEGESIYSNERIIEVSELKIGDNLVRLNTAAVENRLFNTLVCIDGVKVEKSFPATIKIVIEEAVPMVNIHYKGKYYIMSYRNRVIEISNSPKDCVLIKGYVPVEGIEVGDEMKTVEENQTELVNEIVALLEENGFENIKEIDISDELNILINYEDRVKIQLGNSQQLDEKIYKAKWLIDKEIDPNEKVTLNISNVDRAVARPIVNTIPTTTAPPEPDEPEEDTSEPSAEA